MSLTIDDLQAIKELLKPEFDRIDKRFDKIEQRMDSMELRITSIEQRMTSMELKMNTVENSLESAFREIVNEIYDLHPSRVQFNQLETRVTSIEHKLPKHIS